MSIQSDELIRNIRQAQAHAEMLVKMHTAKINAVAAWVHVCKTELINGNPPNLKEALADRLQELMMLL